jgi:hypothetical protein
VFQPYPFAGHKITRPINFSAVLDNKRITRKISRTSHNTKPRRTFNSVIAFFPTMSTQQVPPEDRPLHCMTEGCICCYHAYDCEDLVCCYIGSGDCLCIRHSECCALGAKPKGCGLTTDETEGEICKIGLYCFDLGLINPQVCFMEACQMCCMQRVAALPFQKDYVPDCVCAFYCIQCAPRCGCCVAPPPCEAIKQLKIGMPVSAQPTMQRN